MNIKVDAGLKQASQALAKDLGLTLSSLVSAQMQQLVNNQRLVLEAPYPTIKVSPKLQAALDRVDKEIEQAKLSKPYTSVDEMMTDLKAE